MGSGVWLDDIITFISAQDIIMLICVLRNDIGLCVVHKVAPPKMVSCHAQYGNTPEMSEHGTMPWGWAW